MNTGLLYLGSRFGRRALLWFLVCALVPIAALAWLTLGHVSRTLAGTLDVDLRQGARAYAIGTAERLRRAEAMLADLATDPSALARQTSRPAGIDVARYSRASAPGARTLDPPISAQEDEQLAEGRTLLRYGAGTPASFVLVRAATDGTSVLAMTLRPEYLWTDRPETGGPTAHCLATTAGRPLNCNRVVPHHVLLGPVDTEEGQRWTDERGTWRAAVWAQRLPQRIAGESWRVVAYQPESQALAVVHALRDAFVAVGAFAALAVLLLAFFHVRTTLAPLHRLLAGMQRLAATQDFSTQVHVPGRDEFSQLAASFNTMVARLGQHIGMLKALSRLDRAILTELEIREVAHNSLRCLQMISGADIVSVGLLESDAPETLRVYALRGNDENQAPEYCEVPWSDADRRALAKGTAAQWQETPALPDAYVEFLRRDGGAQSVWVQGIVRADRLWGVVVLGHRAPQPLRKDSQMLALSIADRLAVALSSAARDRQLHQQAHYDALTGLPNRHYLLDLLTQELARARREQYRMSVLFLDLDRFKQTNDTLGHTVGDALLKQAAQRIKQSVRDVDIVARLGGDEFTIVLTRVDSVRDVGLVAQQLIKVLSKAFEIEGQKLYVGASVGIAIYPDDAETGSELLKKADTAMYRAKELGRGRFAFFEERMNADLRRRATLDRELRSALENGEFVLRYQPQIDLATGQLCCAEALIRWQHPVHGLLGPIDFIPIAEDCGLIDTIGAWVLKEACTQQVRWRNEGVPIPRVSVNVSNRQLRRADFVRAVDYILVSTGLPPECLEIEVTESLFLEGGKAAVDTLRSLQNAGVVVAIDDFGTGYSSFSYLRTLPASVLKLDKSFIADVVTDKDAGTIAAAIVNMAHTLRKQVVAEGVETAEQLAFLRELGCEKVQGFLFSRPLPASRIAEFARKRAAHAGTPMSLKELEGADTGQPTVVGKLLAM